MTMASSKDKVKRNNIAMGNLKLHRATAVCIIVTLLLLEQICTATSSKDTVIVFEKSWSVADVPSSEYYPRAKEAATSSFYRILEIHDDRGDNSRMFVGGKNSLTELHLNNLTLVKKITVPKYETAFPCEQIQDREYYCQNYVTFMQEINSTTSILCGTNYLTPSCVMFQPATQTHNETLKGDQDWHSDGISASGPDQNTMTYIKVEGENMIMYSGAPTQIRYSYAFSRTVMGPDYSSVVVHTDTSVSTWIESSTSLDPSFIGQPIEYNGKVYFFFREEAVEARNVAKVVYSRVGQVCALLTLRRSMDSDRESDWEEFLESDTYSDSSADDDGDEETDSGDGEEAEVDRARGIQPYLFEPLEDAPEGAAAAEAAGEAAAAAGDGVNVNEARLGNNEWCSCNGGCEPMPTVRESVCCKEIQRVVDKLDAYTEGELGCITAHPGFSMVCLDRWVLETASYQYIQQYGGRARRDASENEKSRHIAYRQLVRWCWQFLGKRVRVPLPSCAVTMIRNAFPSEVYKGFEDIDM